MDALHAIAFTCFILVFISGFCAFNIDIDNVVSFRGMEGTNFGYSAVMYSNDDGQKWVLVGATEANFTDDAAVITPGNIYKCNLDFKKSNQESCLPMNIRTNDSVRWPDETRFEEDEELLGASMALIDDKIVTCAPLWKNMIPIKSAEFVHSIGRCFDIDRHSNSYTTRQFKNKIFKNQYSPEGQNELSFEIAQIGFSVSDKKYEKGTLDILLGAPGFFEHKGGFLEYTTADTAENEFFNTFTHQEFPDAQKKSIEAGSLIGYAVTTGKLADADGNCPSVIVLGAPHYSSSDGIVGSVFVICAKGDRNIGKSMALKKQFFGRKSGSGFGAAIAFDDISGDGLDDLIVGAPLQYDNKIDTGEVYIYYGSNDTSVLLDKSSQVLKGTQPQSRFGSAIQCIGDLNKDGFVDVAIGAPYENDMRGVLYIYHGGRANLMFTQKIQASNIDLKSFGWYISRAYDIDSNSYPDLLVGSYMSNTVTILRTRPIIKLASTVGIEPSLIPLNSSGLQCQQADFHPCVTISICFSYTGDNVPDSIMVAYNVTSDVQRQTGTPAKPSRVNLYIDKDSQGNSQIQDQVIKVDKGSGNCVAIYANVKVVNRLFFQSLEEPLVMETSYGLSDNPVLGDVQPILNNIPTVKRVSATFSTGCNGTCHPDLQTYISLDSNEIILGATSEIVLYVRVINDGDMSLGTRITIETSNNTKYIAYIQPQDEVSEQVLCVQGNNTQIQCDVPETLYYQQKVIFNVRFAVSRDILIGDGQTLGDFDNQIEFATRSETTSPDSDPSNNMKRVVSKVRLDSRLELKGISIPEQLTVSEKADLTLSFTHRFDVINRGPSPLHLGHLRICLPITTQAGRRIMNKETVKIIENSPHITWRIIHFPGEIINNPDSGQRNQSTPQTTTLLTTTLPAGETAPPSRKRRDAPQKLQDNQKKRTFSEISCQTVDQDKQAIIQVELHSMEKDQVESFDLPVNISEGSLVFTQVSGIYYKSRGNVVTMDDDRKIIREGNTTHYYISSEIYPHEVTVETEKVNIWIIIGGCIAGLVLLILLGVILWKCGFFKRKKNEHVKKWKRQSGYYAKRQSARAGSTKSSNYKAVDEW